MEIIIVIEEEAEEKKVVWGTPDPVQVGERDAKYAGLPGEKITEPHTIKFTPSMLKKLKEFQIDEGYSDLGKAIRELIAIGLEFYPVKAYLESETRQNKYKDHPIVQKFRL